jgi:hypothetical protein
MALANYTRVRISVPGDPGLTVGLTVDLDIISKNNSTTREPDAFLSGKYLVTAVRHMVSMNEYKTILEVTKESTVTPFGSPSSSSSTWQQVVKGNF